MRWAPLHSRQWLSVVACVVLFMYSSACTSWHVVGLTPAEYLQTHRPHEVLLTRTDSSRMSLRTPVLRGDTLLGTVGGGLTLGDTAHHVTIPLTEVQTMAVRKFSPGKTVGLYLIIALPLAVIGCSGGDNYVC